VAEATGREKRGDGCIPFPFLPVGADSESSKAIDEGRLVPTVGQVEGLAEVNQLAIG
jgi:hypothetical protein